MSNYPLYQRVFDYFMGFGNRKVENGLDRYIGELTTGEETSRLRLVLGFKRALRIGSNLVVDFWQAGNLWNWYITGNPSPENIMMTEGARGVINYFFNSSSKRNLEDLRTQLSQMKHESWIRIVEEGAKRLEKKE